jgi:hypothetical protein
MTKLTGDHVQVLVDGYELTGDLNRIVVNEARDVYDRTAFGDLVHNFLPGVLSEMVEHFGFMNADSARSHPVLNGITIDGLLSIILGQNDDPAVGDPMYSLPARQRCYTAIPSKGKLVPFIARFFNQGQQGGWGTALAIPVEITNSATGSSVDGNAASSNGASAILHILAAATSDTYTITVEGSATGAFSGEETTLATFTLDGSALGSEEQTITSSVPQYTRWKAVRSGSAGDTVKLAVNLVRF